MPKSTFKYAYPDPNLMDYSFQFKVWDKEQNKWLEAGDMLLGYVFYWENENTASYRDDRYVIVRSLGLKDRKGNTVYDGSIIKSSEGIFIVRYERDAGSYFTLERVTEDKSGIYIRPSLSRTTLKNLVEVIGHVLEKPEIFEFGQQTMF